eukprot:1369533-Amorphochlora_amoeboformis.AAC.1
MSDLKYVRGFASELSSEALPGSLPKSQNNPKRKGERGRDKKDRENFKGVRTTYLPSSYPEPHSRPPECITSECNGLPPQSPEEKYVLVNLETVYASYMRACWWGLRWFYRIMPSAKHGKYKRVANEYIVGDFTNL